MFAQINCVAGGKIGLEIFWSIMGWILFFSTLFRGASDCGVFFIHWEVLEKFVLSELVGYWN